MNNKSNGDYLIYRKKFTKTNGLINYWAMEGNLNDSIANAHLFDGLNGRFTFDRYGLPNSALSLINGFYKVPPGIYFSGTKFSMMGWVNVRSNRVYSRMFDFGNGPFNENVVLSLSDGINGRAYIYFRSGSNEVYGFLTSSFILNKWQHLACVYSFPYYSIYIDGVEATTPGSSVTFNSFDLANIVRTSNYIGRSNWYGPGRSEQDADADFDDLKIFNRALTQQEIQFEMNNSL